MPGVEAENEPSSLSDLNKIVSVDPTSTLIAEKMIQIGCVVSEIGDMFIQAGAFIRRNTVILKKFVFNSGVYLTDRNK